jgi:hypothetical protein
LEHKACDPEERELQFERECECLCKENGWLKGSLAVPPPAEK